LGPYHIFGEDGSHPLGQNFAALHTSLNRPVHLVVMRPESAQDTEQTSAFLADARAKAKIHHPAILAVYEAGELEGRIFYAIERADGEPLESALLRGTKMDSDLIVKIARTTAECFLHLQEAQIPRLPLQLGDIRVLPDGNVRMQNVALGGLHPAVETPGEIALLGACLSKLLPPEAPASLRLNLQRTALEHPDRISGWEEWLALSNPVVSTAAPSKTENKTPTGSEQKPQQTRRFPLGLVLTLGMGAAVMGALFYGMKPESLTPAQALIPKDQYPVGTGRRAALDEFSLDSTEVTNRQYFKFMDWMREHPREGSRYDHPEQPPHHSHIPKGWEEMFPEKFRPEKDKTNPLLDLPVTQVSWWDAYAFAQWAGRILPTEEQWEAAGRGPRGLLFPWGDEPEPERTNVNRPGYVLKPGETSGPRGVATLNDASVFGVKGLSGNVSEWTSTRRDGRVVVKGGHYGAPLLTLDAASTISPDFRSANIGFRTASPASSTRP
jgi:formylglycine-generating enzyme required for sulfatase activity